MLPNEEDLRGNLAYVDVPETFPWRWMQIEKIAQALYAILRKKELRQILHPTDPMDQFYTLCQSELKTARFWIKLAVSKGWFVPVDREQAWAFRNWLQAILNHQYHDKVEHPDAIRNAVVITNTMQRILTSGFFGSWPYIAAEGDFRDIPESFIMALKNGHAPCNWGGFQVHQMFGAAHEVQDTAQADEKLLLLQLASDHGADMIWGDVGMLQLWIDRDDLKNADFSRVELTLKGH